MPDDHSQPIDRGEIALVVNREVSSRTVVCEVLGNDRIQVTIGATSGGARAERISVPNILHLRKRACGIEAATGEDCLAVQTLLRVFKSIDLDDSAHFPA